MYDTIYGIPVDVIGIYDRTRQNGFAPYDVQKIHIAGLDRKTYISQEQFTTYFAGGVRDNLISVSRERRIGDVSNLKIGTIAQWSIFDFVREELD